MVIKVCGIKTEENIELISNLEIDMIGLNFYPPSVRYIEPNFPAECFDVLPQKVKRVGVFVNETLKEIDLIAEKFNLDYIQLHGDEDVDFCKSVAKDHKIIKVFRIDEEADFTKTLAFSFADYFLFDTATKHFGGSGKKFDWSRIDEYHGDIPFILSGGIGPLDAKAVNLYTHPQYEGIDINSKFESALAIKNPELLTPFINALRNNN